MISYCTALSPVNVRNAVVDVFVEQIVNNFFFKSYLVEAIHAIGTYEYLLLPNAVRKQQPIQK